MHSSPADAYMPLVPLARTAFDSREAGIDARPALVKLNGVGVPTGSALLHFAFPKDYPILDVRALESLGSRGRTTYHRYKR